MVVLWCGLCCVGCWENTDDPLNEQKEAYYLRGKNLEASLDWPGAVEAFKKALEVNPRNASAHFELYILYYQRLNDYAAAIYHARSFLELRPKSEFAEIVRQHIGACIQELAKSVPIGPVTPALQRDFERLSSTNKALLQRIDGLTQQLALANNQIQLLNQRLGQATNQAQWLSQRLAQVTNRSPVVAPEKISPPVATNLVAKPASPPPSKTTPPFRTLNAQVSPAATSRTYRVKSGETLAKIARQNGVSLQALERANPGVDARHLRPGRELKLPSR